MSHIIDLRAELLANIPNLKFAEEDLGFVNFLKQMKTMAYLTATHGEIFPNNSKDHIEWKAILTTEELNQSDFIATELEVYGSNMGFERGYFTLTRCLPARAIDPVSPFERAASIHLSSAGTIDLRTIPNFYPECALFEAPIVDPRYGKPREITKEMFLGHKLLVRGPITSLGPNTRTFMYKIADEAYKMFIPKT